MFAEGAEPQPGGGASHCESCGIQPATVHVAKVEDGKIVTSDLCQSCAAELGREAAGNALVFAVPLGVGQVLGGLLGVDQPQAPPVADEAPDIVCGVCGTTAADVREHGLLGCAACYDAFGPYLDESAEADPGEIRCHLGKLPARGPEGAGARREVLRLQRMLRELVESERFEEAAGVRDRLAELGELPRS